MGAAARRSSVLRRACLPALLAAAFAVAGSASPAVAGTAQLSVSAGTPFVDTGVVLTAGETATITAGGRISYGSLNPACSGSNISPDGCAAERICPVSAGCGALIGRIGNGAAFFVGSHRTIAGPGALWLGINDQAGAFADNSGAFAVTIATHGGTHGKVAKVIRVSGRLYVRRAGTGRIQAVQPGEWLDIGDELLTSPNGSFVLEFVIGGRVYVPPGAQVTVTGERSVNGGAAEDTTLKLGGAPSPAHVQIQTNGGVLGGIKG